MSLHVCPAAVVAAPVETVWELLKPERFGGWIDGKIEPPVPEGEAQVGQEFLVTSKGLGRNWRIPFVIQKVDPDKHQLGWSSQFPLGIQIRPHISIARLSATSCRVQYG